MARLRLHIEEAQADHKAPRFSPAGQGTQMIVGADGASDAEIVATSASLYASYDLKRIYYAAFSPIPDASRLLPLQAAPLQREHRLYQADWLYRFYGFSAGEIADSMTDGMLDLAIDPKLAWALRNRARFPIDVNTAVREELLRIPGLGKKTVDRIIVTRRHHRLRLDDLARLTGSLRRARPFLVTADHRPPTEAASSSLRAALAPSAEQLSLF
jgi:predicted DNA-binding helix-hairpin-helix protein